MVADITHNNIYTRSVTIFTKPIIKIRPLERGASIMTYDVVIIGAGSMGMAAGYYLSKQGKSVALIDAHDPPHTEGSHHGETRVIRHAYGEGETYVPLALRSQQLWDELEQESKMDLFEKTGVLNIGTKDSEFLSNVIQSAETFDLSVDILTAEEINGRWPGYQLPPHLMGCYEKNSGLLWSEKAISAFRLGAVQYGAHLYPNTIVKAIDPADDEVTVQLKRQALTGKQLIITAGKGTNDITKLIGQTLPLTPVRKTFTWFHSSESLYSPEVFPTWSFDDGTRTYYGFPSMNKSGIKIGRHDSDEDIPAKHPLEPFGIFAEDNEETPQFAATHMAEDVQLKEGRVCVYTNTPDGDFIIDRLPGHSNIIAACGFSGHGFKFSSGIGEILSQMVVDGESEQDISYFQLSRFT